MSQISHRQRCPRLLPVSSPPPASVYKLPLPSSSTSILCIVNVLCYPASASITIAREAAAPAATSPGPPPLGYQHFYSPCRQTSCTARAVLSIYLQIQYISLLCTCSLITFPSITHSTRGGGVQVRSTSIHTRQKQITLRIYYGQTDFRGAGESSISVLRLFLELFATHITVPLLRVVKIKKKKENIFLSKKAIYLYIIYRNIKYILKKK